MEELEEEEVWEVMAMRQRKESSSPRGRTAREPSSAAPPPPRRLPAAARSIPRGGDRAALRQSAPLVIPRWAVLHGGATAADEEEEEEEEVEEGMVVPPHEWISKRVARREISSFSMCEGAGRTLKGRDITKVRNAVLTRTGFLEPPENLLLRH
ncbi:unnamed protein product [Spirodela intermedia]|uniref:Uncharacterized protein n=1 Tax=Spirodela intermedia TaxID=51605 RepID=A0A7I8LGC1_SPIIN|nr:unnamed protein product [Spirodela intermedia]